eukprot:463890_1
MNVTDNSDFKSDGIDSDIDDAVQEVLVHEKDLREEAYTFSHVTDNSNILQCIGQLHCKFMYDSGMRETRGGTGTVFKICNGYGYILTAAHTLRVIEYWECTNCQPQKNKTRKCPQCLAKDTSKAHIIPVGKIYFHRKELKNGEFEKQYDCTIYRINDALYEKHPFAGAGYDFAILKFKDDGYYAKLFANKCKKMMLIDGLKFYNSMSFKKHNSYYIFGYPKCVRKNDTTIEPKNMWGDESINDGITTTKHKKTGCFYLRQKEIDASSGTSGAAIFSIYKINNVHCTVIFGVHTGGVGNEGKWKPGAYNIGVLLDERFSVYNIGVLLDEKFTSADHEIDKTFTDLLFIPNVLELLLVGYMRNNGIPDIIMRIIFLFYANCDIIIDKQAMLLTDLMVLTIRKKQNALRICKAIDQIRLYLAKYHQGLNADYSVPESYEKKKKKKKDENIDDIFDQMKSVEYLDHSKLVILFLGNKYEVNDLLNIKNNKLVTNLFERQESIIKLAMIGIHVNQNETILKRKIQHLKENIIKLAIDGDNAINELRQVMLQYQWRYGNMALFESIE